MIETKIERPPFLDEFDPEEPRKIPIGIDIDGVIFEKPGGFDLVRRATKAFLHPTPGASETIRSLDDMEGVGAVDARTVRPDWLRSKQTRRQLDRIGLESLKAIHTNNSYTRKVSLFLLNSAAHSDRNGFVRSASGLFMPETNVERAVLIDDSYRKIIKAVKEIHSTTFDFDLLLNKFALFAFGFSQDEINQNGKPHDEDMCFQPLQNVHTLMLKRGDDAIGVPIIGVEDWESVCGAIDAITDLPENFSPSRGLL